MLKERLTTNIKIAMLAGGQKARVEVLRGLKAAILHEEVAQRVRDTGLTDEQILVVLAREAKKRTEAADIYAKAGHQDRADTELSEKAIIEEFLPQQLSDEELELIVAEAIADLGEGVHMGKVIGAVKAKIGQSADGSRIAAAVKAKLG
jgi:hypothetical protein